MRRGQQDCVNGVIGEDGVQIAGQRKMMSRAKILRCLDVGLDGTRDLQLCVAHRGLDQVAAPAAETDDGCADHPVTPDAAGGCRIASITAALSLSGPSSAIATRNRSA